MAGPTAILRRTRRVLPSDDRAIASNQAGEVFDLSGVTELSLWLEVVGVTGSGKVDVKIQGALEADATARWADLAAFTQKGSTGFYLLSVPAPLPPYARIVWTVTTANVEFVVDALTVVA